VISTIKAAKNGTTLGGMSTFCIIMQGPLINTAAGPTADNQFFFLF